MTQVNRFNRARHFVWRLLECPHERGPLRRAVDLILILLVCANTAAAVIGSIPTIHDPHAHLFDWFELGSLGLFTVELSLRVWCAVESPDRREGAPWRERIRFIRSPLIMIDVIALLPALLQHALGLDLRFVRLLRLLRFLKLARYSPALNALGAAVYAERRSFAGALLIVVVLILGAATVLHLIEAEANPQGFATLADSLWWAVITLTTTGYGDVVPITPAGKFVGGICAILGLCLLALPAGIMANGFADEIRRRDFVVNVKLVQKVPLFQGFDALHLAEIATILRPRSVAPNNIVVRAGDPSDCMYFILSGELEVLLPKPVRLGAGSFFGEMGLFSKTARSATVRAQVDTQLLVLEEEDFDRLMKIYPDVHAEISRVATQRAAAHNESKN